MTKTQTTLYAAERLKRATAPRYLARFYHVKAFGDPEEYAFSRDFVSGLDVRGLRFPLALLGRPSGNTQTVKTEDGQSTIGTFVLPLTNRSGEVLKYLAAPSLTLAAALTVSSPANGGAITLNEDPSGLPSGPGTVEITNGSGLVERVGYGSIGAGTRQLLDIRRGLHDTPVLACAVGDAVTNGEQIRAGQRVELYAGYASLHVREWMKFSKMEVARVASLARGTMCAIQVQDMQRTLRRALFTGATQDAPVTQLIGLPVTIALRVLLSTGTAAAGAGTVQITGATTVTGTGTAFLSFLKPGDLVWINPFTTGEQLAVVSAVGSDTQFTSSTTLTPGGAGLAYRRTGTAGEYDLLDQPNGLAIPAAFVDVAALEDLQASEFSTSVFRFSLNAPEDAKTFVEREIWRPNNCYPFITQNGQYSAKRYQPAPASSSLTLTEDDILEWQWAGGEEQILNQVEFQYDWNESTAPNDFGTRQRYTALASKIKYGLRNVFKLAARGIHTANGGQAIMDDRAWQLFKRFADPPPELAVSVFYRQHVLEIGDVVALTHPLIENRRTGLRGLTNELFEIRDARPLFGAEGKLILSLLHVGATTLPAAPSSGGAENSKRKLSVALFEFKNDAAMAVNATEVETGSVTVTTQYLTDEVHLTARQRLASPSKCGVPNNIPSQIRLGSLTGTVLDGPINPPVFQSARDDKACGSMYVARRGLIEHKLVHTPGTIGSTTYLMSAICDVSGGTSQERAMVAMVKSI